MAAINSIGWIGQYTWTVPKVDALSFERRCSLPGCLFCLVVAYDEEAKQLRTLRIQPHAHPTHMLCVQTAPSSLPTPINGMFAFGSTPAVRREQGAVAKQVHLCATCKKPGHNRTTCKEPAAATIQQGLWRLLYKSLSLERMKRTMGWEPKGDSEIRKICGCLPYGDSRVGV